MQIMKQSEDISFNKLVSTLKEMNDKIGSLSYYLFAIKYGQYLKGVNLTEIIRSAGLTESMSKELSKGVRLYNILTKNGFGIQIIDTKNIFSTINHNAGKRYSLKNIDNFITALHTKPFLLLAGISGTGKSQKVQELAFMTCTEELREDGKTMPGNYCLVEVKPNWHDSTELLGYYSALTGKYELTDFIRFVYKAAQHSDVPFFLCLDEMNLAPVEQYFAEYLSVLETRRKLYNKTLFKTYDLDGRLTVKKKVCDKIVTLPLLDKNIFANCSLVSNAASGKVSLYTPKDAEISRCLN